MRNRFFILTFTCTLSIFTACTCGNKSENNTADEAHAVEIPASVFYNADSLMYYAERAYLHDDPKGLFVTAAAAYLRRQGEMPDSLSTVTIEEAEIMLLHAAELGNADALKLIHCLDAQGDWHHSIPETK